MPYDTLVAALEEALPEAPPAMRSQRPPSIQCLYWGAHRFTATTFAEVGEEARDLWSRHADLATPLLPASAPANLVAERVAAKLATSPLEDLRIDFEDGYGHRSDDEESTHATTCAEAAVAADALSLEAPRLGIRVKAFTPELVRRSVATIDRFVTTMVEAGGLPSGFVVTLPKVTVARQVELLRDHLASLEQKLGLDEGAIEIECMVEVPNGLFDRDGRLGLPRILAEGGPRLVGIHMGVYDLTTSYGIAPHHQCLDHPACDFARALVSLAFSGSGRTLSAGSNNRLPVGGQTDAERRAAVKESWRLSAVQIHHHLTRGFYHGWDLHPRQLPIRYAASYAFFLEGFAAAAARMNAYLASASSAMDEAAVLDDVATGQALLDFFVRARACGAIGDQDLATTGLTAAEVRQARFADVLAGRLRAPA